MKIDTRGTVALTDDRLLPGAAFDLHRDDGDAIFEPYGPDASISADGVAEWAFLVFKTPPAAYWVTETRAPLGYAVAGPEFIPNLAALRGRNCIVVGDRTRCFADDDGSVGFVLAVIADKPYLSTDLMCAPPRGPLPPPHFAANLIYDDPRSFRYRICNRIRGPRPPER